MAKTDFERGYKLGYGKALVSLSALLGGFRPEPSGEPEPAKADDADQTPDGPEDNAEQAAAMSSQPSRPQTMDETLEAEIRRDERRRCAAVLCGLCRDGFPAQHHAIYGYCHFAAPKIAPPQASGPFPTSPPAATDARHQQESPMPDYISADELKNFAEAASAALYAFDAQNVKHELRREMEQQFRKLAAHYVEQVVNEPAEEVDDRQCDDQERDEEPGERVKAKDGSEMAAKYAEAMCRFCKERMLLVRRDLGYFHATDDGATTIFLACAADPIWRMSDAEEG